MPYTAKLDLSADAPGVGPITLPIEKKGQLPVPAVPQVSLQGVQWQNLSWNEAGAVLDIAVQNTNDFPIDLKQLNYALTLSDQPIVTSGVQQATTLAKGKTSTLRVPISFSPSSLGLAALNMLKGNGASYSLDGTMNLGTPFGPIDMPYSGSGQTQFRR